MNKNQDCQNCGSGEDRSWILHNIRHRGIFRRFCTSCVLKFYSGSYCCVCFQVFDDLSALPNDRVFCLKCPSISHLNCVPKKDLYLCPPCSNPTFQFFNLNNSSKNHDGELVAVENQGRRIHADLAKVLLAAAQIASISMSKAATATMLEAESRAKDAAFARKRAKESVEVLKSATFFGKGKSGKEKHKETVGGPHLVKCSSLNEKQKKKSKTGSVVDAATAKTHGSHIQLDAEQINKLGESKDVSDVVDSVDKKKESSSDVIKRNAINNISGKNGDRLQIENCVAVNGNTPSLLTSSESHIVKENIENNGVHSSLPDAEHLQHPPKSNHSVD